MDPRKDAQTNLLLDTIRKELNAIISDSESQTERATQYNNTNEADGKGDGNSDGKGDGNNTKSAHGSNSARSSPRSIKSARRSPPKSGGVSVRSNRVAPQDDSNEQLSDAEVALRASLLDRQSSQSIDEDLLKMRIDLKQSYELFQTIGDKFESINFGQLKNRIKDLHLNSNKSEAAATTPLSAELNDLFQQSYVNNRLDKLTGEMGDKFRKHPGEFGDIPELSAFFKACTQLQNGLEQLKKQRNEASDLGRRMCWASEVSYDRIDAIRKSLDEQRPAALAPKPREGDSN